MIRKGLPDKGFWGKVDKTVDSECWNWLGFLDRDGYGQILCNGRREYAHRMSWILHKGEIPEDMFISHNCLNHGCVNPDHLILNRKDVPVEERFWEKVDKKGIDDCWNWIGSTNKNGYGTFIFNGKVELSHRVSWIIHNGSILDNMNVLHDCDNPSCVNCNHLFLGTHKDNMRDMFNKNRHHIDKKGEKNNSAKLTESQVIEIRNLAATTNLTRKQIAGKYNISYSTAANIIKRKRWIHI